MKCFVTGASGFIGNSLILRLIKEGYKVKGLIHKTKPKKKIEKVEYVIGDITKSETLTDIFNDVDIVYHCAAYVKDYGSEKNFYNVNVNGIKNLIKEGEKNNIKKFVYLGHIKYEINKNIGYYNKTKDIAERYLIDINKKEGFPSIIIRPGNVYGPGATTWVLRPLQSIKNNKISLINNGNGIFHHTYIDNLLDALILIINNEKCIGKCFNVTDGDSSINWGHYLNSLAIMLGKKNIRKNISKKTALKIAWIMMLFNKLLKTEPWVTPLAVEILTNQNKISIKNTKKILGYEPKINYIEGIKKTQEWLIKEKYIQ